MIFNMENLINSLPKPLLVFLAMTMGIGVIFLSSPPHTICDSQEEIFRESQRGTIFIKEVKKNKIPPALGRMKESCQVGNSIGSCFEYFSLLKKISKEIGNSSQECVGQLYEIKEISLAINDGIELMVRLAWGVKPPDVGPEKLGWLQDADLAVFCQLKKVYTQANGEDSWNALRMKIYNKLPGEEMVNPASASPADVQGDPKKALMVMSEIDVFNRSLFSVRCDAF